MVKINSPQIRKYDVIIGWDTEYRNKEWYKTKDWTEEGNYNEVISYQYSAYSLLNIAKDVIELDDKRVEKIVYLYDRKKSIFKPRWTLGELIAFILKSLGITRYLAEKKVLEVLLVSHYSIAEYTTLRNRENLNPFLSEVQDTLTSFKPFIQKVKWGGNHYVKVNVSWKDTYLLTSDKRRSLADIAQTIGMEKINLSIDPKANIENLVNLLEINPSLYERYALEDARITLRYYCHFMSVYYNVITQKLVTKEPITTSDSTAKYFVSWLENESVKKFGRDQKYLEGKILGTERRWGGKVEKISLRKSDESIAGYAYLGGLNTFYRLGKYQCSNEEIALDIDISKAYPSAMAVLPAIDWRQRPKTNFEITEIAEIFNESELEHTKVGIFLTEFSFPKGTYQSSIAQKTEGGLIYTNEGEDFCTWPELTEAVRLKGITKEEKIIRGNIYEEFKMNGKVYLPFAEYLGNLVNERDKYPKGSFENSFFKLMGNGLYGKLAQGIEYRSVYDLNGKRVQLKPSVITCAHYASQITGIIRTCVEVIVNTFNELQGCKVHNATTDGVMITIQKPRNLKIEIDEKNIAKTKQSFKELFPELYEKLISFYPIKLIAQGQKNLGLKNSEWLEIKSIGNEIRTEQTRANYIAYKGITQGLARGNVSEKIMNSKEKFDEFTDNENVTEIELLTLVGIREIKEKGWDLVQKRIFDRGTKEWKKYLRTVNIGYDGKRIPIENEFNSRQPLNIEEWEEFRKIAKKMKGKKERIRIEDFFFRKNSRTNEGTLRVQGSKTRTIIRIFLSAVLKYNWNEKHWTFSELSRKLNEYLQKEGKSKEVISVFDLKNWKKRKFLIRSLPHNEETIKILNNIAVLMDVQLDKKKIKLLTSS